MSHSKSPFILASASPRRLELLKQINITPDEVLSPDIDETPLKAENAKKLALRLAQEKAKTVAKQKNNSFILAADTVVSCGPAILDKAETPEQARTYITKLSGRRHRVYGGIALITPNGKLLSGTCETMIHFKPLNVQEIDDYIANGEWDGKAGGYAIQGFAGSFVKYMTGSYSNVVGLSLYDTMKLLRSGQYLK